MDTPEAASAGFDAMSLLLPSVLNGLSATVCFSLGVLVLIRNWRWRTHQTFALVSFSFMLWAIGVIWIIQSTTIAELNWALRFTEAIPCFMAPFFYHFIGYFPRGKFDGSRVAMRIFYVIGFVLAANTLCPWYIQEIEDLVVGKRPVVTHHWSLLFVVLLNLTVVVLSVRNLQHKYRQSHGFGRRQIEFVITGIYSIAAVAPISAVIEAVFQVNSFQAYTPISVMLLMVCFAYAMVRYHLLDARAFVSQLLVYTLASVFVVLTFHLSMATMNWVFVERTVWAPFIPVLITSMVVSFIFPVVQRRASRFMEVTLLRQRYDIDRLFTRIANQAAQLTQLDALLRSVGDDIQKTIGVRIIRVHLVDAKKPNVLRTAYTSLANEGHESSRGFGTLLDFLRERPQPLILEKILHRRPDERMVAAARQLAELDAYFCLPLIAGPDLVGILTLGQKNTHDIYSEEEKLAFQALAGPLGTAVINARLYNELEQVHIHQSNVFSQMREGVVAVDLDGRITTVNEAATNLMGVASEGDHLRSLPPEVSDLLSLTLREEQAVNDFETVISRDRKSPVPVTLSSACLRNSENKTTGAVALIYDLTLLKRLEQNVQRADRLSSLGTLAAGMAHEIKNPLVSIKTFTQLLLERHMDEDFRQTFRDVVPHEVDRIDTIVSRLLDFARPRPVHFESVDIRRVVDEVLALVENQTRKYNIAISLDFREPQLCVYGDEQQLHQIFLNLFLNAVDAMKEDALGELKISARKGRMRVHDASSTSFDTECVRITVTDTGCGIPGRNLQDLFTPFFTTKDDGCGLGLAVVHGIVTEHGGEIDVTSRAGEGTTFFVAFRLAKEIAVTEVQS